MTLTTLLLVIVLLYVLTNWLAPLDANARRILHIVAVVIVVLLLLQALGIIRPLFHLRRC